MDFSALAEGLQHIGIFRVLDQLVGEVCMDEFVKVIGTQIDSAAADNLENFYCGNYKIHV